MYGIPNCVICIIVPRITFKCKLRLPLLDKYKLYMLLQSCIHILNERRFDTQNMCASFPKRTHCLRHTPFKINSFSIKRNKTEGWYSLKDQHNSLGLKTELPAWVCRCFRNSTELPEAKPSSPQIGNIRMASFKPLISFKRRFPNEAENVILDRYVFIEAPCRRPRNNLSFSDFPANIFPNCNFFPYVWSNDNHVAGFEKSHFLIWH